MLTEEVEEQAQTNAISYHGGGRSVLVVDDEPLLLRFLNDLLEANGFKVSIENDAERALERITKGIDEFDIVLTDQTMPKVTGLELIEQVRTIHSNLPIVLCTGYSEKIDENTFNTTENVRLCKKPINSKKLLEEMRRLLEK